VIEKVVTHLGPDAQPPPRAAAGDPEPHAHGLIAKTPCKRRRRVTNCDRNVIGTTMYLRKHHFPNGYSGVVH
jgi:hypothetical protein